MVSYGRSLIHNRYWRRDDRLDPRRGHQRYLLGLCRPWFRQPDRRRSRNSGRRLGRLFIDAARAEPKTSGGNHYDRASGSN
jgi:hypothetical protein